MEFAGEITIFLVSSGFILAAGYFVSRDPDNFRAKIFAFLFAVILITGWSLSMISSERFTAFAALYGALLAGLGWVITNIQNRYQNRLQHSADLIHHFTQDPELEFHIVRIRQSFPERVAIPSDDIAEFRRRAKMPGSYDVSSRANFATPIFYSIVHLLNFFERIAFLYNSGALDRHLIRRQLNQPLAGFLARFQTTIAIAREGNTETTAYSDLVRLSKEWYGVNLDDETVVELSVFETGYLQRFGTEYAPKYRA